MELHCAYTVTTALLSMRSSTCQNDVTFEVFEEKSNEHLCSCLCLIIAAQPNNSMCLYCRELTNVQWLLPVNLTYCLITNE